MEIMDGCDRSGGGGVDDGCARADAGHVGAARIVVDGLFDGHFDGVRDRIVVAKPREQSERDRFDHRDRMPRSGRPDERLVPGDVVNNRYDGHTRQCIRFLHSAGSVCRLVHRLNGSHRHDRLEHVERDERHGPDVYVGRA